MNRIFAVSALACAEVVAPAQADISKWSLIGGSINIPSHDPSTHEVRALCAWDHDNDNGSSTPQLLAIGGDFDHGASATYGFVIWNPGTNSYITFGGGFNGPVNAIITDPNDSNKLIVGGDFSSFDGTSCGRVIKLKKHPSTSAIVVDSDLGDPGYPVYSLAVWDGYLYAGVNSGGSSTSPLTKLTPGTGWGHVQTSLASGYFIGDGTINVLYPTVPPGGDPEDPPPAVLMIGGSFSLTNASALCNGAANTQAKCRSAGAWNGTEFTPLGGGVEKEVHAYLAFPGEGDLAVGGYYLKMYKNCADDEDCSNRRTIGSLAKWTGTDWSHYSMTKSRRGGMKDGVYALTTYNNSMVYGGKFGSSAVHSDPANCASDNELCYDVSFITPGEVSTSHVGLYTTASGPGFYRPLGSLNNNVYALAVCNGQLYAGGNFSITEDDTTGYFVAAWSVGVCSLADIGSQGGSSGPDGLLDNNDFIVFIDYFFNHDAAADVGTTGGIPGSDSNWDNNDFIVFIDYFFSLVCD